MQSAVNIILVTVFAEFSSFGSIYACPKAYPMNVFVKLTRYIYLHRKRKKLSVAERSIKTKYIKDNVSRIYFRTRKYEDKLNRVKTTIPQSEYQKRS